MNDREDKLALSDDQRGTFPLQDPPLESANTSDHHQDIYDGAVDNEADDPEEEARVEAYQSQPFFRRYLLECILFLYTLGTNLYLTPLGTLISVKICVYNYHHEQELCDHLENATESIKNPILDDAQLYGFINDAVINVPGALAALISGNYVTRYGFRTPLVVTLVGAVVSCLCQFVTVLVMPAPVYMNTLAELPGAITGGSVLMLTATYSYIALRVPHSLHLQRIMLVGVFSGIGLLIGVLTGGALATWIGYTWLWIICLAFVISTAVAVFCCFEDIETPPEHKNDTWGDALWVSAKTGFSTALAILTVERPQRKRKQMIAILGCFISAFFGLAAGNGTFAFSYARSVLKFNQAQYGLWNGVGLVLVFVLFFPLLEIIRKLKLSHPTVIVVGSFCFMLKFAMLSLTEFFNFLYYLQLVIGIPFYVSLVSMRSYATDLLDVSDVPVVMALFAAIEKIVPVISGVVAAAVYHFTNTSYPGCVFLIMAVNYIIPMVLGLYCRIILKRNKDDMRRNLA